MSAKETDTHRPSVPLVRIFLSSPSDVAEERKLAREFVKNELPYSPSLRGRLALELIAWDDPAARIPMLANETPQESVNAARPRPATCDIVIVILWSRMGTPLPDSILKPDGARYLSGTEWEYEDAINAPRKPRPQVLLYRRTEKPKLDIDDPDFDDKRAQFRAVEAFFARFRNPDGSLKGGVNEYATPADFKPLLRQHLDEILHQLLLSLAAPGGAMTPAVPRKPPVIPPAYLEWLRQRCSGVDLLGLDPQEGQSFTLSQVYVPLLTRQAPRTIDEVADIDAVQNIDDIGKLVPLIERLDQESLYVPAAPGAGKSTFCRWAALQSIPGPPASHPVPAPGEFTEPVPATLRSRLPLLVPLREFGTTMDCAPGCQVWGQAKLEESLAAWLDELKPGGLTGALLLDHLKAGTAFVMLDGVDEVPLSRGSHGSFIYPRALLLSGLINALPAWQGAGNRILLTSRPWGLRPTDVAGLGLPEAWIEPLPRPLQDLFVTRWFDTLDKRELTAGLIGEIYGRQDLSPLAETPMLLTALCVIYGNGKRLPENRYDLYESMVENVLYNRYRGDASERGPVRARLEAIALGMHEGDQDAGARLQAPVAEVDTAEIERLLRKFAQLDGKYVTGRVEPAVQCEELLRDSGLLQPRPGGKAAFLHLSFQEFLAAVRIACTSEDNDTLDRIVRKHWSVAEWRPTLVFLFAGLVFRYRNPDWGLRFLDRLAQNVTRDDTKANPVPALFLAEAVELCLAKGWELPPDLKGGLQQRCLDAIEDEIELQSRQALGLCLGRLGDPRIFDLRDTRAYVEVPAGTYPYGDKGEKVEIEAPFLLGRYPVTNSQYRAFLEDGGYAKRDYWSDTGWAWLQEKGVDKPLAWDDRRWNGPNQPVVGVSFWEAEACCRWAGGRLQKEREWEAANSDSGDSRKHWGDGRPIKINISSAEGQLMVTAPVGLFPSACGPQLGLMDINGNAWEWCDGQYNGSSAVGPINNPEMRVLRGGSFAGYWIFGKISPPGLQTSARRREVGFRCVLAPPRQP